MRGKGPLGPLWTLGPALRCGIVRGIVYACNHYMYVFIAWSSSLDIIVEMMHSMSLFGVRAKRKPSKPRACARILAETVTRLDVKVATSQEIGGGFPVLCDDHFEHTDCRSTQPREWEKVLTLTESVKKICGDDAVVLEYKYAFLPLSSTEPGQIRLLISSLSLSLSLSLPLLPISSYGSAEALAPVGSRGTHISGQPRHSH